MRSAGSPEPGRTGGAGTRERSMEGEKRPRSYPGPSVPPPAGARSGSIAPGLSATSSALAASNSQPLEKKSNRV